MPTIETLTIDHFRIPVDPPMQAAAAGVISAFELVTARITDSEGATGVGFTVMQDGQGSGAAITAERPFRKFLMGQDADRIEWLWQRMYRGHHYAGRGGPVSFALAAVDVALWDLKARRLDQPLWKLLGGHDQSVRCYAGNIDLNYDLDRLLKSATSDVETGFRSVKMRLGRPTLAEDMDRVAAMRAHLPAEIELMADANEAWRVDQAARAMAMLQEHDLVWLEEPIVPDNLEGYSYLRGLGRVPIAAGENMHTLSEFTQLIMAKGADFIEPDLTTLGGITPWMKVAHLAEAHGLPVTSHGSHDLHVHVMAAVSNATYLEWFAFDLSPYMADPLRVKDGFAQAPDRAGHGITLDWDKLAQHRIGP